VIYCLSQHHTGTWSTLAWVSQHDSVRGLITYPHIFDALERKDDVIHRMESGEMPSVWHPTMVYHEHVRPDDRLLRRIDRAQVLLATMTPTVIPIRDPLAALISYQVRAEREGRDDFDPAGQVDGWIRLAETSDVFKEFAHIKFLCWDLAAKMDRIGRYTYLREIARDLGLAGDDDGPSAQCGVKVIRNNDLGRYALKRAYSRRDLTYIRRNVSNGGFEALRACRGILRPFLERLGYRDLLWWS
jgi:hypothetical protein